MSTKPANNSIHTITFRYTDPVSNKIKTSKLSIDIGIYELLKLNEKTLKLEQKVNHSLRQRALTITDKWIYETAGIQKEKNPNVSFSGYMREFFYTLLIDSEYLIGYDIKPEYCKIMCRKDAISNTTIRIPTSLFFALTSILGQEFCETTIREAYLALRTNTKDDKNFSFLLRHKLLEQVMKPDVKRIDFSKLLA